MVAAPTIYWGDNVIVMCKGYRLIGYGMRPNARSQVDARSVSLPPDRPNDIKDENCITV
jgi:hypothetical protein